MARPALKEPLTAREEQILFAFTEGLTDREIAAELFLSRETVKQHVSQVLAKMNARNRTHAVALAYHLGLLVPLP